jgi:hypothetical protein
MHGRRQCLMLDHLPMDKLRRPDSIHRALLAYGDVQDVRVGELFALPCSYCPSRPFPDAWASEGRSRRLPHSAQSTLNTRVSRRRRQQNELSTLESSLPRLGGMQVTARFAAELHQLPFGGNDAPSRTLYLGRVPSKVLLLKRFAPATVRGLRTRGRLSAFVRQPAHSPV